jgi:hypothetical protein
MRSWCDPDVLRQAVAHRRRVTAVTQTAAPAIDPQSSRLILILRIDILDFARDASTPSNGE